MDGDGVTQLRRENGTQKLEFGVVRLLAKGLTQMDGDGVTQLRRENGTQKLEFGVVRLLARQREWQWGNLAPP